MYDLRDETDNCINLWIRMCPLTSDGIPNLYIAVSCTYILSVASLSPSHPHFIAVTSFDGSIHIVDLRSPESDTVLLLRQRGNALSNSHLT